MMNFIIKNKFKSILIISLKKRAATELKKWQTLEEDTKVE